MYTHQKHYPLLKILVLVLSLIPTPLLAQTVDNNSTTTTTSADDCTLCHGGAEPTGGSFPGGTSCQDIATSVKSTPASSTTCQDVQVVAFQHCACPALPQDICALCSSNQGQEEYASILYPSLIVPNTMTTCGEAEFLPCSSSDNITTIEMKWYCGCPTVVAEMPRPFAECQLCDNNDNAFSHPNRILPPHFNSTCQQYDRTLGSAGCGDNYQMFPINVASYCGCQGQQQQQDSQQSSCSLCANYEDDVVQNPLHLVLTSPLDVTCQALALAATYVKDDPNYCFRLQNFFERDCCEVPTTAAPATASTTTPPPVPVVIVDAASASNSKNGSSGATMMATTTWRQLFLSWGLTGLLLMMAV